MSNYYVVRNKKTNQWGVRKESADRVSSWEDNQREAEKLAKEFSSNTGGGEVRIQGMDGKFRDSDTVPPANDPFPPRDKKY